MAEMSKEERLELALKDIEKTVAKVTAKANSIDLGP